MYFISYWNGTSISHTEPFHAFKDFMQALQVAIDQNLQCSCYTGDCILDFTTNDRIPVENPSKQLAKE